MARMASGPSALKPRRVAKFREASLLESQPHCTWRYPHLRPGEAKKVLGWPKRRKLAHAFLWGYSYKRLKLAQLLGQLDAFLTRGVALRNTAPKSH